MLLRTVFASLVYGSAVVGTEPTFAPAPAANAAAEAPIQRPIYINSHCKYPIRFVILHRDSGNAHHPHGWYEFAAYDENRLMANGVTLQQVVGEELFLYAETVSGGAVPPLIWGGTDRTAVFEGTRYAMRRVDVTVNPRGELEVPLTCDGL